MPRYVLSINENTLSLIQAINGGVRPQIEEKPTCFLFDVKDGDFENPEIKFEDDMYDENGVGNPDVTWLIS